MNPESDISPLSCVQVVRVDVEPGICGFACTIRARKSDRRTVTVSITGSECKQVRRLSSQLTQISLRDLFLPMTRNPVYIAAEKAGCHASCAIPLAVLKAVEVSLGVALPKTVRIEFTQYAGNKGSQQNG